MKRKYNLYEEFDIKREIFYYDVCMKIWIFDVVIKRFYDYDKDYFAKREAEELLDKLNEK